MSEKATPKAMPAESAEPQAQDAPAQVTLTEFCVRLSESVRRPELIAAFEYRERRAGTNKDTIEAFKGRFETFVNTPV